jgi:ATP-binding cassette subfamily C (CFTR/MRP) protein 5
MKALLDYTDAPETNLEWGLLMVGMLMVVLLLKNLTQTAMLAIGAHTASRVIGGYQFLAYRKLLEWRSAHSDTLVGQLTNFCANDMDRVLEAVYLAPIITSVPVMFIACMVYAIVVMGAWVLLGILTIFIFYPVMVSNLS